MAVKFLDKTGLGYFWSKIKAWCNATFAVITHSHAWSAITGKPTTVSGYGITDAKIANGTITLGSNSITPLTSHQDISGKVNKSGDTMTGQLIINRANGSAGGGLKLTGDAQNFAISICDISITKGTAPSVQRYCGIEYYGNDNSHYNKRLGILEFTLSTANLCTANLRAYNCTTATNTSTCTISCNVDSSGNAYTAAPTPATADNSTKIATTAFVKAQGYITSSGSITGNAATATKLETARSISAGNLEFQGSASFDGSGNIALNVTNHRSIISVGNTNNYPFHRIAYIPTLASNHTDGGITFLVNKDFTGGGWGICRIIIRTNNATGGQTASCTVQWLVRSDEISADSIQAGFRETAAASYIDVFYKSAGTYNGAVCRVLAHSNGRNSVGRGFTVVSTSTEVNSTTATDPKTSVESYKTIADAGTALHNQVYTSIITASDVGVAKSATDSTKLPLTGGTVTGTITAASGAGFNQRHASYIKGNSYSSNVYMGQGWHDKNGTVLADLLYYLNTPANDGNAWIGFRVFDNPNTSSSEYADLGVMITSSGDTYATCPTPSSTTDNSVKIATTAWVRKATGNTALNAASATKLATARTINGVSFNGTANITVADSTKVAKSGDTMTGTLTISNTLPLYYLRNTNVTKGTVPSAFQWSQIIFFGKTGSSTNDRMGFIEQETRSDGWNMLRLSSCRNIANTFDYAWLSIDAPNNTAYKGYVNFCGIYKDQALINNDFSFGTNPSSTTWWSFANHCRNDWLSGMWGYVDTNGLSQIELRARGNSTSLSYKHFWIFQNKSGDSHAGVDTNSFRPTLNTFSTLGIAGTGRWGQIYSTSATINTSDERQKCDIEAIPDDVLDAWETCEFYQYRMKDSVDKKGDNARYHTGMIAQRLDKKFKDANENLNKYGLFCYDEWDDIEARKDEKDNIIEPAVEAGNEYSIRYEEALCMEAAYQRRKNKILENRISELEKQVSDMLQILQSLKGAN